MGGHVFSIVASRKSFCLKFWDIFVFRIQIIWYKSCFDCRNLWWNIYDNTVGFSNEDSKGMLYLYEASFFAIEGEKELELARNLTEKHLIKRIFG